MPSSGQIIPQYLHPHVMTVVNDNTVFQESVSAPDTGMSTMVFFTSPKGRDGVLIDKTNEVEFIQEFGVPNFRLNGQAPYNALALLKTGLVNVRCMRVMPDDAAYSNVVIVAKVKVEDVTPPVDGELRTGLTRKMSIKFEALAHQNLLSANEFEALTDTLETSEPDSAGFMTIPIMGIRVSGRGEYGNTFRVRILPSPSADKDTGLKNYRVEVIEVSNGPKRVEFFEGSLDTDSVGKSSSLFLDDIINDSNGSNKITSYINIAGVQKIFNSYTAEVNPDSLAEGFHIGVFDLFYGMSMNGASLPGYEFVYDDTSLNLGSPDGIVLSCGSEGSFAVSIGNPGDVRDGAIETALLKGVNGQLDSSVKSKRRCPVNFLLDANYPASVKRALIQLSRKRDGARVYIDAGFLSSATEYISWLEEMESFSHHSISKDGHHYKIKDPYTGKIIPVTTSYLLAQILPKHINEGSERPLVGESFSKLRGHIKNSLLPVIDVDDSEIKERIYELKGNYFEAIGEDEFVRATQTTSQSEWSDLSEENNSLVLFEIQNEAQKLVNTFAYNFADAEDRLRFKQEAERVLEPFKLRKVAEVTVDFKMNDWEKERSILHCYIGITYRTLGKRAIIELDINKR